MLWGFAQTFLPTTLSGWAALISPLLTVLGALGIAWKKLIYPINHRIDDVVEDLTKQIEDEIAERTEIDSRLRKEIFSIRTIAQTYVGKVDILDRQRDLDQVKSDGRQKEYGRLEMRVEGLEKKFESIMERLNNIEAFNEYRILPILERIEGQKT